MNKNILVAERKRWERTDVRGRADTVKWWAQSSAISPQRRQRFLDFGAFIENGRSENWVLLAQKWTKASCELFVLPLFCVDALARAKSDLQSGMRCLAALEAGKKLAALSEAAIVLEELVPLSKVLEGTGRTPDLGFRDAATALRNIEAGLRKELANARGTTLLRAGPPLKSEIHAPLLALHEYLIAKTGSPQHSLVKSVLAFVELGDFLTSDIQDFLTTQKSAIAPVSRSFAMAENPLLILDPPK